jgi:hypothetical protein
MHLIPLDGCKISGVGHKSFFRSNGHATPRPIAKPQLKAVPHWGTHQPAQVLLIVCLEGEHEIANWSIAGGCERIGSCSESLCDSGRATRRLE